MIEGRYYLRILFILLFSCNAGYVIAQPTLPDIAGYTNKGIVILSWLCQYNGVRSITVLHSTDSIKSYSETGHVKSRDKGVQAFADGHPEAGRNFYKLVIMFNSGLTWTSNYCRVYVDKTSLIQPIALPGNDSLQKYLVFQNIARQGAKDTIVATIRNESSAPKNKLPNDNTAQLKPDTSQLFSDLQTVNDRQDTLKKQGMPVHKIFVSSELDSSAIVSGVPTEKVQTSPPKKKIKITFADPVENSATFVISGTIFKDPVTGHIHMNLPDDVKSHHYFVKFYDGQGHVAIDIPKISTSRIVLDKRNFQQPGMYKFILRKDVTEYERGYITITPTP